MLPNLRQVIANDNLQRPQNHVSQRRYLLNRRRHSLKAPCWRHETLCRDRSHRLPKTKGTKPAGKPLVVAAIVSRTPPGFPGVPLLGLWQCATSGQEVNNGIAQAQNCLARGWEHEQHGRVGVQKFWIPFHYTHLLWNAGCWWLHNNS